MNFYALVEKETNNVALMNHKDSAASMPGIFTNMTDATKVLYKNDLDDKFAVKEVDLLVTLIGE